jgi:hypothetical protein
MGYYGTICPNCGGPAIFFSFGPRIECSNCRRRYDFVNLLIARSVKVAYDDEAMLSTCTSVESRSLEAAVLLLPIDED